MLNDVAPVEWACEAEDALVLDVRIEEGDDVEAGGVLDVDVVLYE